MGATSDCLQCICDVIDIINDHHGYCVVGHSICQLIFFLNQQPSSLAGQQSWRLHRLRGQDSVCRRPLQCSFLLLLHIFNLIKFPPFFGSQAQNTTSMECMQDSMSAASECIHCICDVIDIIEGGEGYCPQKDPLGNPIIVSRHSRSIMAFPAIRLWSDS